MPNEKLMVVVDAAKEALLEMTGPALEGAKGDLGMYAKTILTIAAEAYMVGEQAAIAQIPGQVRGVAEINRIRLARGFTWEKVIDKVLILGKLVMKIATA